MDVLVLTALVSREGQTAPWFYYPPLLALATDEAPAIRRKALDTLKQCIIKQVRVLLAWILLLLEALDSSSCLDTLVYESFTLNVVSRDTQGLSICWIALQTFFGVAYPKKIGTLRSMPRERRGIERAQTCLKVAH